MNCKNCNQQIPDESMFCNYCGYRIIDNKEESLQEQVRFIEEILSEKTNYNFNDKGKLDCEKWIKEFGFKTVVLSTRTSIASYLKYKNEKPTEESIDNVFSKISGICYNTVQQNSKPYLSKASHVAGIINKTFNINEYKLKNLRLNLEKLFRIYFEEYNDSYDKFVEDIMWEAKKTNSSASFHYMIEDLLEDVDN